MTTSGPPEAVAAPSGGGPDLAAAPWTSVPTIVNLEPDDDQSILLSTCRTYLERKAPLGVVADAARASSADRELWAEMAELGWLGAGIPAEAGGTDSLTTLGFLCEELGRALFPLPFVAVAVAGAAALDAVRTPRATELLASIGLGRSMPVLAVTDPLGRWTSSTASCRWDGRALSGAKGFVESGASADAFLVSAVDLHGHPVLVLVRASAPGVTVTPTRSMAGSHWTALQFESATGELLTSGWHVVDAALTRTAAMHAAWCAGAATRLLEDTSRTSATAGSLGSRSAAFRLFSTGSRTVTWRQQPH